MDAGIYKAFQQGRPKCIARPPQAYKKRARKRKKKQRAERISSLPVSLSLSLLSKFMSQKKSESLRSNGHMWADRRRRRLSFFSRAIFRKKYYACTRAEYIYTYTARLTSFRMLDSIFSLPSVTTAR